MRLKQALKCFLFYVVFKDNLIEIYCFRFYEYLIYFMMWPDVWFYDVTGERICRDEYVVQNVMIRFALYLHFLWMFWREIWYMVGLCDFFVTLPSFRDDLITRYHGGHYVPKLRYRSLECYPTRNFTWIFRESLGRVSTFKFPPTVTIPFLFYGKPNNWSAH